MTFCIGFKILYTNSIAPPAFLLFFFLAFESNVTFLEAYIHLKSTHIRVF